MPKPSPFSTAVLAVFVATLLVGCLAPAPRDLSELAVQDSLYVDPGTGAPYSGPVFRAFADAPDAIQLEGELRDGEWDGELRVYHPNGHIRYMGSFAGGQRCGPWTENADSLPTEGLYEQLVGEIEALGMYPPCPER